MCTKINSSFSNKGGGYINVVAGETYVLGGLFGSGYQADVYTVSPWATAQVDTLYTWYGSGDRDIKPKIQIIYVRSSGTIYNPSGLVIKIS